MIYWNLKWKVIKLNIATRRFLKYYLNIRGDLELRTESMRQDEELPAVVGRGRYTSGIVDDMS